MPLSKLPDGPFAPLVIGVIGRRLLRNQKDADALKSALIKEIDAFKEAYRPAPIIVATSLAPGADTLAAEAADACGVSLRAVLPMEAEYYRESTSFDTDDAKKARENFDDWLKKSTQVVTLKPPTEWGDPPADWHKIPTSIEKEHDDYRTRLFVNAGAHVVNRCDVLIALWDGETDDPSITGELVSLRLDGVPPDPLKSFPEAPLDAFRKRGPAVILHTPKVGSTSAKPAGAREVRTPSRVVDDEETGVPLMPESVRTFGVRLADEAAAAELRQS